jgi:hypothetical protein
MTLVDHSAGNYRFLPGIAPYSCGVVAAPDYEIVHVTLHRPIAYRAGFARIAEFLDSEKRPKAALCGVELRSPRPFTFAGFIEFNTEYAAILESWDVFVRGINPVARTNVAPAVTPPAEPQVYGFSYTKPASGMKSSTFIVAGGGELQDGKMSREFIEALGDVSEQGMASKTRFVMDLMEHRLTGLGVNWQAVTVADIYTIHSLDKLLPEAILARMRPADTHGVHWHYSRPPIEEIEFEMDLRGVNTEIRI